jgi:hypothetical protein
MKPIVFGIALAFCGAVAATSQAQQAPAPAPAAEPAHKVFVLTGCLTGSAAPTTPFRLTGAMPVGQAPQQASAAGEGAKDVYELLPVTGLTEQGLDREELQSHVGKKVEATVRPVEVASDKPPASSTTPSTVKPEAPPQRYTVTKITAIAASCS